MYEWAKITPPETLTDIQKAARFYYLQKLAFGGKVEGRSFGTAPSSPPRLNLLRMEEDISNAHLRLSRAYIERLDWQKCLTKYDREYTLFYADPPYWQTEGYGVEFELEQYQALASHAETMKGKIIISINDHPEMRQIFSKLNIQTTSLKYTVGGSKKNAKLAKELIINNW